ncbi:unnamed protein product, partial [Staurois parvus]
RKVPSPEAFLGKPWSTWIDAAKIHCSHNVDLEETGKDGGKSREVMRLNKEDMHLFRHYPAHDDFYLVVCNVCNQVVKPQVFQSHCAGIHPAQLTPEDIIGEVEAVYWGHIIEAIHSRGSSS